jgi:alcohol dehydrogenase class IV
MGMSGIYDYLPLERVVFGKRAAEAIRAEVERLNATRVFIVASKTLSRHTEEVAEIVAALGNHHAGTFDDMLPHVPREKVMLAMEAVRSAEPDLFITIGGGSPIDLAKMLQICMAEDITEPSQLDPFRMGAQKALDKHSPARQIVVPTTLSGGEFSNIAGCTDTQRNVKEGYLGLDVIPKVIVYDPAATVHTPDWLWLSTGIRAVDHACEGFCALDSYPFIDGGHLHALRVFARSLRRNLEAPDDLEARLESQQAVWLATVGLTRVPYGGSHAIGHALGGTAGVPHGYTSCCMLPVVLKWNESVNGERQKHIAEALGRPGMSASEAVAELIADLGLPGRLRDAGVTREQLPEVAEAAMHDFWIGCNPRPIRDKNDVLELLEAAY